MATTTKSDTCAECGAKLAPDQRYCVNCGAARGEPRLDVSQHLGPGGPTRGEASVAQRQQFWTPVAAVGAIAVLGAMLLLGVLIGKDEDDDSATTTVTQPAATTAAPTTPAPTATTPAAPTAPAPGTTAPPESEVLPPPAGDIGGGATAPPTAKGKVD